MTTSLAIAWLGLIVLAAFGFGKLAARLARSEGLSAPVHLGLGVAALVAFGGVLALARLATPPMLIALLGIGAALGALALRRSPPRVPAGARERLGGALSAGVVSLAVGFAAATQLTPSAFNRGDDFEKYFAHTTRLLATGTFAGNALSGLGSETLGGQAFLQGLVLAGLPLSHINALDSVIGLLLLLLLCASVGPRSGPLLPLAFAAPLLAAVLNPQVVNVSALYMGATLFATALLLVADGPGASPHPSIMGLVYAAVIALKPSFGLFAALHLPLAALALRPSIGTWAASARWLLTTAAWAAIFLAPWLVLYVPQWGGAWRSLPVPHGDDGALSLVSAASIPYGASLLHYSCVALAGALAAGFALVARGSTEDEEARRRARGALAGGLAGLLCYVVILIVMGPLLGGSLLSLRYSIPFLLGASLVSLALALRPASRPLAAVAASGTLAAMVALVAAFAPSFIARVRQAATSGSILAFARVAQDDDYRAYSAWALSDVARTRMQELQALVPRGQPLLAWVNLPFLLDYGRNPIFEVAPAGLATPWAGPPPGVRYVLRQRGGYAAHTRAQYERQAAGVGAHERLIGQQCVAFLDALDRLAGTAEVLHADGNYLLLRLPSDVAW